MVRVFCGETIFVLFASIMRFFGFKTKALLGIAIRFKRQHDIYVCGRAGARPSRGLKSSKVQVTATPFLISCSGGSCFSVRQASLAFLVR